MTEYRKEFYRKGLPYGNSLIFSFLIDTEKGTFKVHSLRTSKNGGEIQSTTPDNFISSSVHGYDVMAQRLCKQSLKTAFSEPGWEEV